MANGGGNVGGIGLGGVVVIVGILLATVLASAMGHGFSVALVGLHRLRRVRQGTL